MSTLITVIHCVTCFFLVIFVLVQSGKGAEISASFGGSSQTVFGSSGGANFFVKVTGILAAVFFTTSLVLTVMGGNARKSLFESTPFSATAPAAPVQMPSSGAANSTAPLSATAPKDGAPAQGSAAAPAEGKPATK